MGLCAADEQGTDDRDAGGQQLTGGGDPANPGAARLIITKLAVDGEQLLGVGTVSPVGHQVWRRRGDLVHGVAEFTAQRNGLGVSLSRTALGQPGQ